MANIAIISIGCLFLVIAIIGYIFPIASEENYSIPQVVALCNSGMGQLGQAFSGDFVKACSDYSGLLMGVYGSGVLGLILIIVGVVVSPHKKPQETRKEWICEHCDFKSKEEVDLIGHYKEQHADEKGDTYHRKYGKKPPSPETLEILKRRYAQGEITRDEFDKMKKDLE